MSQPLVSIIIPTYNRAHIIGETLDSVLEQTYTNWECIIVDDGSTDNTEEVVSSYILKDIRFKFVYRPDKHQSGGNGARNYGFKISNGDFLQWLDSDDLLHPEKIEKQVFLLKDKNLSVAFCSWCKFDKGLLIDNSRSKKPYFKNYNSVLQLLNDIGTYGGYLPCHSYLVSRGIINQSDLWNESLLSNQDGEFFARVLMHTDGIYYAPNVFVYSRKAADNMNTSRNNSVKKVESRIKSWMLIEKIILKKYGVKNTVYVQNAKKNIYKKLNKKYAFLKYKYVHFFGFKMLFNKIRN